MKKQLNKLLRTEVKATVTYRVITISAWIRYVIKITSVKQIEELWKDLLTATNATKIRIC